MNCKLALLTVLDHVDYTVGNCGPTEMVGAILPVEIIKIARESITKEIRKEQIYYSSILW